MIIVGRAGRPEGVIREAHRASIVAAVGMGKQVWDKGKYKTLHVHTHFIFRVENGQRTQSIFFINDLNIAKTSQPEAQRTDD